MKIMPPSGSTKGPEQIFTGDVYFDVIVMGEKPSRVRANSVHFAPGAHTAWHSHALGQYLHVTEGVALVQERGGEIKVLRQGETIYTEPGVWHWHGMPSRKLCKEEYPGSGHFYSPKSRLSVGR